MADADMIAETRSLLEAIISRPKLPDKLLGKPPFRFLHDIISNIAKETGFGQGLYEGDELDSGTIKGKKPKIAYLSKIIACVGIAQGSPVDVRPQKIVAGAETDFSNRWLQALATVATDTSIDFQACVDLALQGAVPGDVPIPRSGGGSDAPSSKVAEPEGKQAAVDEEAEARKRQEEEEAQRRRQEKKKRQQEMQRQQELKRQEEEAASKQSEPAPSGGGGGGDGGESVTVNSDVAQTRALLESVISRPKLADKLLGKPPFRFLHDIVCNLANETGFGAGLYSGDELDSGSIRGKKPKVAFLTKVITCTALYLRSTVQARPNKIVAGLETDLSNRWMQKMAIAAQRCKADGGAASCADAVQQVLDGASADPSWSAELSTGGGGGGGGGRDSGSSGGGKTREPEPEPEPAQRAPPAREPEPAAAAAPPSKSDDREVYGGGKRAEAAAAAGTSSAAAGAGDDDGRTEFTGSSETKEEAPARRQRPRTARRRPPKLRENAVETETSAPATGGGVAVMLDGESDDEEEVAVEEDTPLPFGEKPSAAMMAAGGQHSRLVRDILDEEKKAGASGETKGESGGSGSGGGGIRMGRLRKKQRPGDSGGGELSESDLHRLRHSIQTLCQSTNPLSKCMDYVHEDMDTMKKELESWRSQFNRKREQLEEVAKETEESLRPLQQQRTELQERIDETRRRVNLVKASISKNDDRVRELLRMVISV